MFYSGSVIHNRVGVPYHHKGSSVNIYVGNLSRQATEDEVREAFQVFGQVTSVAIIKDRDTRESRGFGFDSLVSRSLMMATEATWPKAWKASRTSSSVA